MSCHLVNMCCDSVPKPNHATVLKLSSMKDMSTDVCENEIFPQMFVCSNNNMFLSYQDKSKINSKSPSARSTAEVVTGISVDHVAVGTPKSSRRRITSPQNNEYKKHSDSVSKEAKRSHRCT